MRHVRDKKLIYMDHRGYFLKALQYLSNYFAHTCWLQGTGIQGGGAYGIVFCVINVRAIGVLG